MLVSRVSSYTHAATLGCAWTDSKVASSGNRLKKDESVGRHQFRKCEHPYTWVGIVEYEHTCMVFRQNNNVIVDSMSWALNDDATTKCLLQLLISHPGHDLRLKWPTLFHFRWCPTEEGRGLQRKTPSRTDRFLNSPSSGVEFHHSVMESPLMLLFLTSRTHDEIDN